MTEWHELVVEGAERTLRAFVAGFLAGRGEHAGGVFGSDVALEPASLGERLKALFAAGSHHVFLAPARIAAPLAQALGEHGKAAELELERHRRIDAVRFSFRCEVFAREIAAQVRGALLASLPAGVRVENLSEQEEAHPEARGPEPFAPLHAFTYCASGDIVGSCEGVLDVWQRSRALDFVQTGALHLDASDVS